MTFAQGRSNIRAEIQLMEVTLLNMINSIESHFLQEINSLKANIFDIINMDIPVEEKNSLSRPFFEKLEETEILRYNARNKIIICIYSICEASIAGICNHYHIPLKRLLPNKSNNYYLTDYLFSLGADYTTKDIKNSIYVIYTAIRPLRNYLTHSNEDIQKASTIVDSMITLGFTEIEHCCGRILIQSRETLKDVLQACNDMLLKCEQIAITKQLK